MSGAVVQIAFVCGCGSDNFVRPGLCARCERRARLNRERFAGLREAALKRDDGQCQTCGERDPEQIVVHHRRPGVNRLRWFITLCRGCHLRVHLTNWRGWQFGGLLFDLWLEAYRRPRQFALNFQSAPPLQIDLFQNAAGVWVVNESGRVLRPAAAEIAGPDRYGRPEMASSNGPAGPAPRARAAGA